MNKYEIPEIRITEFNAENIVTLSSKFDGMIDTSNTIVEEVSYSDVIAKEE